MESQLTPGAPGAVLDYSRSTPGALPEHSRAVQETAGARNHVTQPNYTVPTKAHPALHNLTPALRLLCFEVYHQVHQTVQVMTLQVSCNLCGSHYHEGIWPIRILRNPSCLAGALEKINRRGHPMKVWFVLSYSQKVSISVSLCSS